MTLNVKHMFFVLTFGIFSAGLALSSSTDATNLQILFMLMIGFIGIYACLPDKR